MNSVRFNERMSGWISFDELSYNQAMVAGRRRGTSCTQQLTIEIDDVDRFIADPNHPGRAQGFVRCDELGGELRAERGWFNLFVVDGSSSHRRMLYRLFLRDRDGRALTLSGFKDVQHGPQPRRLGRYLAPADPDPQRPPRGRARGGRGDRRDRDPAYRKDRLRANARVDARHGRAARHRLGRRVRPLLLRSTGRVIRPSLARWSTTPTGRARASSTCAGRAISRANGMSSPGRPACGGGSSASKPATAVSARFTRSAARASHGAVR